MASEEPWNIDRKRVNRQYRILFHVINLCLLDSYVNIILMCILNGRFSMEDDRIPVKYELNFK